MILDPTLLLTEQPARRGFLRNLIAAPAAALATHRLILPAQTVALPPAAAAARLEFHIAGAEAAMREIFPGALVRRWGNALTLDSQEHYRELFAAGKRGALAICAVDACVNLGGQS